MLQAPETLNGSTMPDPSADMFSLAMLVVYLMLGRDPFPPEQFPTAVSVANFTLSGGVC